MLRVGHRWALGVAQPRLPGDGDKTWGPLHLRIFFFSPVTLPVLSASPWAPPSSDPPRGSPPSLQVLETCMKSCGKRFHDEVGKFRFLNELIKVVSPKVGAPVHVETAPSGGWGFEGPGSPDRPGGGDRPPNTDPFLRPPSCR